MNCLRNLACLRILTAAEQQRSRSAAPAQSSAEPPARGSGGGMDSLSSDMFFEIVKHIPTNNKTIIPRFLSTCKIVNECALYTMDLSNKKPVKNIFDKVSKRKVTHLNLRYCDLSNLTDDDIPNPLPDSIKTLDLNDATSIPPALISRALNSHYIEVIGLWRCDLSGVDVPETLSASLKKLDLWESKNTLPALISKVLAAKSIEELVLGCYGLTDDDIPNPLSASLKKLDFRQTYIPSALILGALTCPYIKEIYLWCCDLGNLTDDDIPETLPASLKKLDLSYGRGIPRALILGALNCPYIEEINLSCCDLGNLTDDDIPEKLPASLKKINLGYGRHIPRALLIGQMELAW